MSEGTFCRVEVHIRKYSILYGHLDYIVKKVVGNLVLSEMFKPIIYVAKIHIFCSRLNVYL